jgi:hypothetical protein
MTMTLTFLAFGSIFFGFLMKDLYVGLGTDVIYNSFGH